MKRSTLVALAIGLVASACDGPAAPSTNPANAPSASPPSPTAVSALQALAGSYDLRIALSDQCTELTEAARQRSYRVTLEATPFDYLGIDVTGGGYATPTATGELRATGRASGSANVAINWNNFDVGGCDGWPEQQPDGSQLMVCGGGSGVSDGAGMISVSLQGSVLARRGTSGWRSVCLGVHQFTFTKR